MRLVFVMAYNRYKTACEEMWVQNYIWNLVKVRGIINALSYSSRLHDSVVWCKVTRCGKGLPWGSAQIRFRNLNPVHKDCRQARGENRVFEACIPTLTLSQRASSGFVILFAKAEVSRESTRPTAASRCVLRTSCQHFDHINQLCYLPSCDFSVMSCGVVALMHACSRSIRALSRAYFVDF